MKIIKLALVISGVLCSMSAAQANDRTLRASEVNGQMWSDLQQGKLENITFEFRQGDEIPMTFEAQGDFLETRQASVSYITVKRNFWIKTKNNDLKVSLDGRNFKKLEDVMTGTLAAGFGSQQAGGPVNAFNVIFNATAK